MHAGDALRGVPYGRWSAAVHLVVCLHTMLWQLVMMHMYPFLVLGGVRHGQDEERPELQTSRLLKTGERSPRGCGISSSTSVSNECSSHFSVTLFPSIQHRLFQRLNIDNGRLYVAIASSSALQALPDSHGMHAPRAAALRQAAMATPTVRTIGF